MVFESIVVDVLNRFLGDYVENLNRSQLKLGIWGGDVVLENLVLKQNALEELNIPVQTVYGLLGKLTLKIPWKNLYGASVEATVDRLFLIVNPNAEVKYDEEKEEKMQLASKQAELARIEDATKREAMKDEVKIDETFVEKLVTQIIKNVQLTITDIHVRYEDSITNPKAPFSMGITLHNLSVHTTDENWKPCIIQEAVTKIFKILSLEGLAVYWNPKTELYSKCIPQMMNNKLQAEIAKKNFQPSFYDYVLGPINATSKLKLNPKPEADSPRFSVPKVTLSLHMEQLSISLNKRQYRDMMLLADSMDRMSKGMPYRKYRPDLKSYRGFYKDWWRFAYASILEEEVKRKRRNWDWTHMLKHRTLCKDYSVAYQNKLMNKGKIAADAQKVIDTAEKHLDLFNLVVIRQKIVMEVERLGKLEEEARKERGWFSSWWSGAGAKDDQYREGTDILKQFQNAMTSDEKAKLFRAIDYQENSAPAHLPPDYVAVEGAFQLDCLQLTLTASSPVLTAAVAGVRLTVLQRPSANAIRCNVEMHTFTVFGVKQGDFQPEMVVSKDIAQDVNLLDVMFETKPLDNLCDQRIKVRARPLQIVYDAETVIQIVDIFKPPEDSSTALTTLQAAAGHKLLDLKEKSALGMQYAVHQHTFVDIDIDIDSSYIIVPQKGQYKGCEACAVVKLGAIWVRSAPRAHAQLDVAALIRAGRDDDAVLSEIARHSYDRVSLGLAMMQVVVSKKEEDWLEAISLGVATPLHLLQPTTLVVAIDKCLISNDPRLPALKVRGELDKIAIGVSEDRLLTLFEILVSMPLPPSEESTQLKASESKSSSLSLLKYLDPAEKQKRETARSGRVSDDASVQMTDLEAFFVMKELSLSVNRATLNDEKGYDKFLEFTLSSLELTVSQKTFNLEAMVRLGAVDLSHHRAGHRRLYMVQTLEYDEGALAAPDGALASQYLFTITYSNVDKKCPEFRSVYGSVEQLIKLNFTRLKILLHLETLQEIFLVTNQYQKRLQEVQSTKDRMADAGPLETIFEESSATKSRVNIAKPSVKKQIESIQMKMIANIGTVEIEFSTDRRPLSLIRLQGAAAGVTIKSSYTEIEFNIASLNVQDLNQQSIHTEILKVLGGDVVNVYVVMFNREQFPAVSAVDISVEAQLNQLRIVFLNWYLTSMLEFLSNFQAAQAAIIEASSQAADAARERAAAAYQSATKLLLKVRLAAPIIIVPENSQSETAIIVDLGLINICNQFIDLEVAGSERRVTVDQLSLELENMKVSCASAAGGAIGVAPERKLLRPISFTLLVKRSLATWQHELPDMDVSGRINTINITIGHSDYQSIMKILNQNLQEGQVKVKEVKSQQSIMRTASKVAVKNPKSTKSLTTVLDVATDAQVEDDKSKAPLKTTMKFAFTMDSFVINLSSTNMGSDSGFREDVDLARFSLSLLSVKGRMLSDGSMNTTVLLVDCTLDDTRPNRGAKITRYLQRRQAIRESESNLESQQPPEKIRSMIDITYSLKRNDTFIDMRIFSFDLILAMDFLLRIGDFMSAGLAPPAPHAAHAPRPDKSTAALKKKSAEETEGKKESESLMTVNIHIEQPDIILVESLEQRECDALVLNMEARFKLRQSGGRTVADGGISGLQVAVRTLGGGGGARLLLATTHVSLTAAQPAGAGLHVDIAITDIKITMSPEIISLLNRVLATMTSSEEQTTELENKAIFYTDLWAMKEFKPNAYWYLKTEEAEEALDMESSEVEVAPPPVGEVCLLSSPSIVVSFEMQVGRDSVPVLVLQASLQGQLKDWSSEFQLESTWAMQVSYYNMKRAEWEPLLEPVEKMRDCVYRHEPWELNIEMLMSPASARPLIDATDEAATNQAVATRQANKTITLSSSEPLDITITGAGCEVLTQLGNSFSASTEAHSASAKTEESSKINPNYGAPYVLHNITGLTVKLMLEDNDDFTVFVTDEHKSSNDYKQVVLEAGASVPLVLRRQQLGLARLQLYEPPPPLKLAVQIVEMEEVLVIPVDRADKRYFSIGRGDSAEHVSRAKNVPFVAVYEPRGLISDIVMQDGAVQIYLRSVLQVSNSLSAPVLVYYMTRAGNEVRLLGEVAPAAVLRLPLQAVYTPSAEIFFSVEGFTVSASPFIWRELQQEVRVTKLLHCESKDKASGEKFYLKAVGTMEQVFYEQSNRHTFASSCYDIVLKPAVKLQNCLPVPITVSQLGLVRTQTFQPGETYHLSHLAPNRASIVIMIENYLDKCWVCTKNLPEEEMEFSVFSFESHDSPALMTLDLGMHNQDQEGIQFLSLYCPFWMLNKTGFTLCYRKSKKSESGTPNKNAEETGNVIFHQKEYKDPILFSFRAKNFFGKKKAAIRIEFGEWSEKFSLDVPGSSGVILCKLEGRTYQVAVTNQLTFNSLTKMVIFTPFYLLINEAPFDIQYREMHRAADPWQKVEKNSSAPLWPVVEKEEKMLQLRVACSQEASAPVVYTEQHSTCLKLDNTYGGLFVEVELTEGGTYVTLQQYKDGHAPALLVNYTDHTLTVYERENVNTRQVSPMHQMLYAWDNPAGPQVLIVGAHKRKEVEIELRQDGFGEFMVDESSRLYWVSFLDGLQRVVLVTADGVLAAGAHTVGDAEPLDTQLVLAMHGLGLSLVNDADMQEIIYLSVSNSGIIWEQCKMGSRRYKKIEGAKLLAIEEGYQAYLRNKVTEDETSPIIWVDAKTEVDFDQMRVLRPAARILRRTLEPGLWASYGTSSHSARLHARLHRLQVDQQLPLPTFPVVLAPVPPPRSVAHSACMKPFIEVSIVERIMEHSKVRQYKYYKVLIQEFHVKVDMGLVTALLDMFPQKVLTEEEALEAFKSDLRTARQALERLAAIEVASDHKNFYDNLHLSPLKMHVSFSLGGSTQLPSFVGTLLQSIGVTLTDMNDVVFKLSYYEKNYEFLSPKELVTQVQNHYVGQALKQLYVLVLGLDVIGNPYGLVIGLKKGVEDLFYEPIHGAIQGPGEFAEGLFLGVRSLVGHTVGGAAGAVSRITGAMGHGLAALSLDKDFQRRRRDNMNKPPANLQEGLARSGKGLVMGVVDGVTGVFTQPVAGAREAGAAGFLRGLGKGAVGLVARPTAGVVDFAAGSLDAVKRAADLSEEVTKMRPARYLPPETGVRPYSRVKAEGYKMLFELEKGKFITTDSYEAHVWVIPGKEVVLCTDKRILYLEKNQVFGGWQIMWGYLWSELGEAPSGVARGVFVPAPRRKLLGVFPSAASGKVVFLYDEQQRKFLLATCERLMRGG